MLEACIEKCWIIARQASLIPSINLKFQLYEYYKMDMVNNLFN